MRRVLLLMVALLALSPALMAQDKNKKAAAPKKAAKGGEIEWLTVDELQVKMKKQPRKVFVDVYTGWCGWCKVMDKKTFSNPEVVKYINSNFYALKLDAERKDSIRFAGKMFGFVPEYKANMLAVELMRGQMSYPTTVIMEENFQNPQPIPGYLDVPTIERILKYLNEGIYKVKTFDEFSKEFKPSWPVEVAAQG